MKTALIISMIGLVINIVGAYLIWIASDGLHEAVGRLLRKISVPIESKSKSSFNENIERAADTTKLGFSALAAGFMLQLVSSIIQIIYL